MNVYLLAAVLGWATAQLVKFALSALKGDLRFVWFFRSGGMPSAHTATVVALAFTVLFRDGFDSSIFAVASVLAAIVVYDSLGVRRAVGDQAGLLDVIATDMKIDPAISRGNVKGHTPDEVLGGLVVGVFAAFLISMEQANEALRLLAGNLEGSELLWVGVAGLVILSSGLIRLLMASRKSVKKLDVAKKMRKLSLWTLIVPGGLILLLCGAAAQGIDGLSWRLWVYVVLAVVIGIQSLLAFNIYRHVPAQIAESEGVSIKTRRAAKKRKKPTRKK